MVDNFKLIENYLPEEQEGNLVYHLMVLKRKKDHPHLTHKNNTARVIKSYAVKSRRHLQEIKEDIIGIAEATQSRIMINLSPKDMEVMGWTLLRTTTEYVQSGQFNSKLYRITDSVLGAMKPVKNRKLFLWDIDGNESVLLKWNNILKEQNAEFVITVPTKNGWHIHTKPFNYTKIQGEQIDMHKNNPTILYVPKSLDAVCKCENYEVISTFKTGIEVNGKSKIGTVNVCKCKNCGSLKNLTLLND